MKIRIATNKITGKRYIVNKIEFRFNKIYCWGEVCSAKLKGTAILIKHESAKIFQINSVDITEVERTWELAKELFDQFVKSKRESGCTVHVSPSGKTATIMHKPPQTKTMTRLQFEKRMKNIGKDTLANDPDMSLINCAYDLADCALHDKEVLTFCQKEFPGKSRDELKYIVADYIVG